MKKIDHFTNMYSLSKTLRFELKPVGKTLENFQKAQMLEEDQKRSAAYKRVKLIMDKYHKVFISRILSSLKLNGLGEYSEIYFKSNRNNDDNKKLEDCANALRKQISNAFTKDEEYKKLFGKDMIESILPNFDVLNEDEIKDVNLFKSFSTYFQGFYENRKNMYTGDGKSTEIAFRIINQNLPKFLDNIKVSKEILNDLPEENLKEIESNFSDILSVEIKDLFSVDYFNFCLAQEEIDLYNQVIGGIKLEDKQIKGLNNYINEYNQQHPNNKKLPKLNTLFKQILSDKTSMSFVLDKFSESNEVILAIREYYLGTENSLSAQNSFLLLNKLISSLTDEDLEGINVQNSKLNGLSHVLFSEWNLINDGLCVIYDNEYNKKETETYYEKRKNDLNKISSFSVVQLQEALSIVGHSEKTLINLLKEKSQELINSIETSYTAAKSLVESDYPTDKNLREKDKDVEIIKTFLDNIIQYYRFLDILSGKGDESNKNQDFYAVFSENMEIVSYILPLYNKVRNFITSKPYSNEKIKLTFNNPQFLNGWDKNKEPDYMSTILRKGDNYYLCVTNKDNRKLFEKTPEPSRDEENFEKMIYKLLPGPNKMLPKVFFSRKGIESFSPTEEILGIYKSESFKQGSNFDIKSCHKLIDFYKEKIQEHPDWKNFKFNFSNTESYSNIGEFFREVSNGGYSVSFVDVPTGWLENQINDGKIFMFQIYNKDFSQYSKGTPNLHTLYFKALFDPENMKTISYKLSGYAEMFYRKKSLSNDKPTHPANQPIENKNPHSERKTSTFAYDLVKDKRYTVDKFFLHLPIEFNYKGQNNEYLNADVRYQLRTSEKNYVIGIDRGERHLLYVCVIDDMGNIVEQFSLNSIENDYNNKTHKIDYHELLANKESERTAERKNWKNIQNIKELKQGYLSQVVSKVCELVEKYDAVVVMENLNSGFKNSRIKIEKQVYQKFENMLIEKLRYRVKKSKDVSEPGGLYKAYQLTNSAKFTNEKSTQNGFIFYIPAWNTSKIDPTTGFVNLLSTKYESIDKTKQFIDKFDGISYNSNDNVFEFDLDYDNFKPVNPDYKKRWTLTTYGERIKTEKDRNNIYTSTSLNLTEEFISLFKNYDINIRCDLKPQILSQTDAKFYKNLMYLIKLMLQMRNSESGGTKDYLISPVINKEGKHYCSDDFTGNNTTMPQNADANGAYNIALKGLWAIEQIKKASEDDFEKTSINITNKEWLEFIQKRTM